MWNIRHSLVCLLLLGSSTVFAQENLPYSSLGLGEMANNTFVANRSMGGISAGFRSPQYVNFKNPASYASLKVTTFETAIFGENRKLTTATSENKTNFASVNYLALAFPVSKRWGSSFGLIPFSRTSFSLQNTVTDLNVGNISSRYEGGGSLNQFFIGNALRIGRGFSVGVNVAYIFGTIRKFQVTDYPSLSTIFSTRTSTYVSPRGFRWNAGVQYQIDSIGNRKLRLVIGAYGTTSTKLKGTKIQVWERGTFADPNFTIEDTIFPIDSTVGKFITLPQHLGFGITLSNGKKWLLGADIEIGSGSDLDVFGIKELSDNWRASIGAQYMPNPQSLKGYWKLVQYRAGFYYGTSPIKIGNDQLTDLGMTFGLGLPIRKLLTKISLGIEIGNLGTTDNGLIKENYTKMHLGLTLSDRWFLKRKYD